MFSPVVLILPDIHGRQFYKNAISAAVDKNIEIVCLGDYLDPYFGEERGGKEASGSILWADFFEHTDPKNQLPDANIIQVVGHTQLNYNPVRIDDRLFCLDCREPFYIDSDGIIRCYHNDKSIMDTDNFTSNK